jgi:predicted nucleic acid-binding protein
MFIDSSVLIEIFKGNEKAVEISQKLIFNNSISINEVVYSEVMYQLCFRKKFPKNKIGNLLLKSFNFLKIDKNVLKLSLNYIDNYGLKPNDSLIFATCKYYKITKLITLDEDYREICNKEGIKFINSKDLL